MRNIGDQGHSARAGTLRRDADRLEERILALARLRPLRDPLAATCEHLALTPPQIHALLWLGEDGPLTMGELARRVSVTEKTVTGIVDRLERDGHLARERDTADRRVVRTRLTPRGEEVYRRIDGEIHGSVQRFLALLDATDRKALLRIVERIIQKLGVEDAAGAHPPPRSGAGRRKETEET
ncbi:MAG: MarR family transcriptional regulator [Anaeromyxobacteraceae bacterium]